MRNTVSRNEFLGNKWLFLIMILLGITIPFAIIYLIESTVRVEHEVDEPEELVRKLRRDRVW